MPAQHVSACICQLRGWRLAAGLGIPWQEECIDHTANLLLPLALQAPLIALYNKYKDSKGKQAKLKSPGQLQELLDVVRALLADMEAKSSSQRCDAAAAVGRETPHPQHCYETRLWETLT